MIGSTPMSPEDARSILSLLDDGSVIGQADAHWALETIANLDYDATYTVEMGRVFVNDVDRVKFPDGTKVTRTIGDWEATGE